MDEKFIYQMLIHIYLLINNDTILWKNNLMMDVDGKRILIVQYNYYLIKIYKLYTKKNNNN